jgi:hypothetical protein
VAQLPSGWQIVSLHYSDRNIPPRVGPRPSDSRIADADAIRVSYTPPGESQPVAFRTIHGASSRQGVGDIIENVILSPGGSPL